MMNLMKNVDVPTVVMSDRLELRLLTVDMAEDLNSAVHASLEEFKPWFVWVHPKAPTLEETIEFTGENIQGQENKEEFHYCIYLKGTNTMVGRVSLDKAKPDVPSFNIGYWLDSRYTGKGYMLEAASALVNMAWNELPVRRLEIYHDSENEASAKVIAKLVEKFGFHYEGEEVNCMRRPLDDTLRSHKGYALTRNDD